MNQQLFETENDPKPLSLRRYAEESGRTFSSVQRFVKTGVLSASVVRDHKGAPKIRSREAADREIEVYSKRDHVPLKYRRGPERPAALPDLTPRDVSKARREKAEAEHAELRLARARRELVPVKDVELAIAESFTRVRNGLLGIPSKLKQERPDLDTEAVMFVDALIRQTLTALSERRVCEQVGMGESAHREANEDDEDAEAGVDEAADYAPSKK